MSAKSRFKAFQKDMFNYQANLGTFYEHLPPCHIKFMYFGALDFDKTTKETDKDPYVGECFRKLKVQSQEHYIVNGRTPGFFYVYSKSGLKYFISKDRPTTTDTADLQ